MSALGLGSRCVVLEVCLEPPTNPIERRPYLHSDRPFLPASKTAGQRGLIGSIGSPPRFSRRTLFGQKSSLDITLTSREARSRL